MSAPVYRGDAEEVLRQASAVLGRPVTLWEVTDARGAVARATSGPPPAPPSDTFDLHALLRGWNVRAAVGSRWIAAPPVVAPVRSRLPAPPPGGRERRSRERLALELAGLVLGLTERAAGAEPLPPPTGLPAMIAHEASNPLAAARGGLQLAMESIGRWMDLAADRRLALLDDLGQVIEDIDRATEFLRAMQDRARSAATRAERFDAVRLVRSCLTLERRLLRDRGIELDLTGTPQPCYLRGDPSALFDLLVNLVRSAADAKGRGTASLEVRLARKGRELELTVRDRGAGTAQPPAGAPESLARVRSVAEGMFGGTVRFASQPGEGTTFSIFLPLPPQREAREGIPA
ncbi:MAG: sensor histidine kinase [Gemmatimonadales bacterium]